MQLGSISKKKNKRAGWLEGITYFFYLNAAYSNDIWQCAHMKKKIVVAASLALRWSSTCIHEPRAIAAHTLTHTHTPMICLKSPGVTWCERAVWEWTRLSRLLTSPLKLCAGKWGAGNKGLWGSRRVSPRTHTTQQIKAARGRVWWGNHTGFQSIVVQRRSSPPRPTIEILIRPPVS